MKRFCISMLAWLTILTSNLYAHRLPIEKAMAKAQRGLDIELLEKRGVDPTTVTHISILDYVDTVFPNARIAEYRNLESIFLYGLQAYIPRGVEPHLPVRLEIDTAILRSLPKLKYLVFLSFDFSTFPSEFFHMRGIEGLSLTGCLITAIPDEISNLKELKYLAAPLNYLTSLPITMRTMDSLQVLELGNNHFSSIPTALLGMSTLRKIDLGNFNGKAEDDWIGYLQRRPLCINHIDWEADTAALHDVIGKASLESITLPRDECSDALYFKRAFQGDPFIQKVAWDYKPSPCPDIWPERAFKRFPVPESELAKRGKCLCRFKGL